MIRRALVCALLAVLPLALSGCEMMQHISEGAYRNAVADGTIAELDEIGVRMDRRPDCTMPETGSESIVRVHCTGRTVTGARVVVTGDATAADTARPRESYTVTVNGHHLVRKDCLGRGCR
ncbi:hypothetical protein GCM10010191_58220 [Actinomadura vinacea]|uniref:DUF4333 domain-containing protein n=1 Tax=Actinomadura vinacea TaxID=115336 RepID=A0ABP5WTB5_9ACTN